MLLLQIRHLITSGFFNHSFRFSQTLISHILDAKGLSFSYTNILSRNAWQEQVCIKMVTDGVLFCWCVLAGAGRGLEWTAVMIGYMMGISLNCYYVETLSISHPCSEQYTGCDSTT